MLIDLYFENCDKTVDRAKELSERRYEDCRLMIENGGPHKDIDSGETIERCTSSSELRN